MKHRSWIGVTGTSYSLCIQLAGKFRIGVTEQSRVSRRFLLAVYRGVIGGILERYGGSKWELWGV